MVKLWQHVYVRSATRERKKGFYMRKYLLAAVAAAAIATPAVARDGSGYIGLEGGVMLPEDQQYDLRTDVGFGEQNYANAVTISYDPGIDIDAVAGYDFGRFRAEAELGWKRANVSEVFFSQQILADISAEAGEVITSDDFEVDGRANILSLMGNVLLDFGDDNGLNGYVGAGFGRGRFKIIDTSDGEWAMQALAGIRFPVGTNLDAGLKYRYFHSGHLDFSSEFEDASADLRGRYRSHSLLLSLIYNFAAPVVAVAPPPPPPPPPPATQTCPDGSVILATEVCPAPPPPPPPPPPAGERG